MRRHRTSRTDQRRIALARISRLLSMAEEAASDPEMARRYVHLARRIAMRCKVRMPGRWRRRLCRRCNSPLVAGTTCVIRLRRNRLNVTCKLCGKVYRYPR